jgi:DENN domain-containing protein 1
MSLSRHQQLPLFSFQLADMRKRISEREFDNLLNRILKKPIPNEESYIHFTFSDANAVVLREFSFKRPSSRELPSIPESHNLSLFFNFIQPTTMIEIFAALLAERRIIFKSSNLEKLSSCLQASCSLLYPMTWQHIFIPILPTKLKDYLLAPMP